MKGFERYVNEMGLASGPIFLFCSRDHVKQGDDENEHNPLQLKIKVTSFCLVSSSMYYPGLKGLPMSYQYCLYLLSSSILLLSLVSCLILSCYLSQSILSTSTTPSSLSSSPSPTKSITTGTSSYLLTLYSNLPVRIEKILFTSRLQSGQFLF